ncbi:MAG TPA: hypothetical protein VHP31_02050 [Caproicibacter sp.]|nr:hypothetical protein [Caproicibacter sp.]
MEQKNLRKTSGMPLILGLAGGVLLLIGTILQSGVSTAYVNYVYSTVGLNITISQNIMLIISVIGFLIYPGIFLLLLLLGMNQPKRGTAFAVVWIVFSGLGTLSGLVNLIHANADLMALSNQLVPGGYYLYSILSLLGQVCILLSCIAMLKRLHQPEGFETPTTANS